MLLPVAIVEPILATFKLVQAVCISIAEISMIIRMVELILAQSATASQDERAFGLTRRSPKKIAQDFCRSALRIDISWASQTP